MEPVNSGNVFHVVMCNRWHTFKLVEGGQYVVKIDEVLLFQDITYISKCKNFSSDRNTTNNHVITELLLNMFVSDKQNKNVDIKFNAHDTFLEH